MKEKKNYLEYCRCIAIIFVVMIHVVSTPMQNWSSDYQGDMWVYSIFYHLGALGVPLFLMISGSLLLNPDYQISIKKIYTHSMKRLLIPLCFFGTVFALMEIYFNTRTISIGMFPMAVLNVINGNSWAHLWYMYTIIGLYILLPVLHFFVKKADEKLVHYFFIIGLVFGFLIPTINAVLPLSIQLNLPLPICYVLFFMSGYYIDTLQSEKIKRGICIAGYCSFILFIGMAIIIAIKAPEKYSILASYDNIFVYFASMMIFIKVKKYTEKCNNRLFLNMGACSFGIYLMHPIITNIFYKVLKIQPIMYHPWIAIPVFTIIFIIPVWLVTFLMKKIPIVKNLV